MFEKYIRYFKDNPQGYWFKRKIYGWGWVPVKWQGWAVLAIFLLFITWIATNLVSSGTEPTTSDLIWYFTKLILAVAVLIYICYKTGEKPRWQWGLPDEYKR